MKTSVFWALLTLSLVTLVSVGAAATVLIHGLVPAADYRSLKNAAELDALLGQKKNSTILIDLRDRKDFEEGHIPGAFNIANKVDGSLLATWIKPFPRDKQIVVICYAGNRSARAFELLVLAGFTHVADYSPGYIAYVKEKGESYTGEAGSCNCPEEASAEAE